MDEDVRVGGGCGQAAGEGGVGCPWGCGQDGGAAAGQNGMRKGSVVTYCHSLNSTSTQVESDKAISWTTTTLPHLNLQTT